MRVLLLTQYFHPEPELKGLPLATQLIRAGHEVIVLTGFPNYPTGALYPGYRLRTFLADRVHDVRVMRVGSYLSHNRNGLQRALSYLSFAAACVLAIPRIRFRPDVIYIYNLVTLVPVAVMARWFWGSRIVIDVQDLWPESVAASGMMGRKPLPKPLGWLCDVAYRAVDLAIVQSPGFRRRLETRGVSPDRLRVVYNWAPGEGVGSASSSPRYDEAIRIVYAGTIGSVQALDVVLRAAADIQQNMPHVRFTFIGTGSDLDRLQTEAASLSNVEFLGWMSQDELAPILRDASALLLHLAADPLFRDTIPSKLQQYLYVGRPILCGVAGDASDLVEASGSGIPFTPEDPADLVRAVQALDALTPDQRKAMGRAGTAFYQDHLAQVQGLRQMVDLITAPDMKAGPRK